MNGTPDWSPFRVAPAGDKADPPRSIHTPEGVGDRMRAAAFAELQAREAFLWGAERWTGAPEGLRRGWRILAIAEQRHLDWLLARMAELGVAIPARRVSDQLWHSLVSCRDARDFAFYMASAEDRGRRAGERFYENLRHADPVTAEIFRKIAEEEVSHIELPSLYYPQAPVREQSPTTA